MRNGRHHHDTAMIHALLVEDRKPYSCMSQFDRPAENEDAKDDWIEKLKIRLQAFLDWAVRGS